MIMLSLVKNCSAARAQVLGGILVFRGKITGRQILPPEKVHSLLESAGCNLFIGEALYLSQAEWQKIAREAA